MDITKQNKPVHLHCPSCGCDISINGNKIRRKYDKAKEEVAILQAKLTTERERHGKTAYYKKLSKRLEDAKARMIKIKNEYASICSRSENELFMVFKKKLFERYGKEEMIKLLEECEDEMFYFDSEFMKQDHNNFTGA